MRDFSTDSPRTDAPRGQGRAGRRKSAVRSFSHMDAHAVSLLLRYGAGSFIGFVGITRIASRLPFVKKLDKEKRFFVVTCITSLCMSLIVTPLALYALHRIYFDPASVLECSLSDSVNIVNRAAISDAALIACGLTCGYFLQDCMNMLLNPQVLTKELGGASAYAIMWMHHVLSLLIWPYSLIYSKAAFFVIYFLATEVCDACATAAMLLYCNCEHSFAGDQHWPERVSYRKPRSTSARRDPNRCNVDSKLLPCSDTAGAMAPLRVCENDGTSVVWSGACRACRRPCDCSHSHATQSLLVSEDDEKTHADV